MTLSKKELGLLLKEARKMKAKSTGTKYTQQMLANDINKSQSYIGDIESGRSYPSFSLLSKIAECYDVPISFFDNIDKKIDHYIENELDGYPADDKELIRNYIVTDPAVKMNYIYDNLHDYRDLAFDTALQAIKFILEQPSLMAYGGYSIKDMPEDEIIDLANDLLLTLKISLERKKSR